MHAKVIVMTGLILISASALGEEPRRVSVYVQATAEDSDAKRFVFEVREQVRKAASLRMELDELQTYYQLRIVALKNTDSGIAYSVVHTYKTFDTPEGFALYGKQFVGTCGISVLADCARTVVAQLDNEITENIEAFTKLWREAEKSLEKN